MAEAPNPPIDSRPAPSDNSGVNADRPAWRQLTLDACAIIFGGAALMLALQYYIDNSTLITGNGIWKSLVVRKWKEGIPVAIDFANFFYFPLYGRLLRLLPVGAGDLLWRWMAMLNTPWSGLALAGVYLLARQLGLSRGSALAAAALQAGCAFFIGLSVTSEDIMPGHAVTVLAIVCCVAALSHTGPRWWLLTILAAGMFDLAWFFEWRLMFPLAPAIGLAHLLMPGDWRQRLLRLGIFIAFALVPVVFCALALTMMTHGVSPLQFMWSMLWTGKGVGSGWGGWSLVKWGFLFIGVTQYLVGGGNFSNIEWINEGHHLLASVAIAIVMTILLVIFIQAVVRRRDDARWRAGGVLLLGNLLAGQVFNLYSQPQDPQMHIHLMMWLPLAGGIIAQAISARASRASLGPIIVGATAILLGALNLWGPWGFAYQRGVDSKVKSTIEVLEKSAPPDRTGYVFHSFELSMPVLVAMWGSQASNSGYLDTPTGRMKWMAYCWDVIDNPKHSPEVAAEIICHEIDRLFNTCPRVVCSASAAQDEMAFIAAFATVTNADKPRAIYLALHKRYKFTPAFDAGILGPYFEMTRRAPEDFENHGIPGIPGLSAAPDTKAATQPAGASLTPADSDQSAPR